MSYLKQLIAGVLTLLLSEYAVAITFLSRDTMPTMETVLASECANGVIKQDDLNFRITGVRVKFK